MYNPSAIIFCLQNYSSSWPVFTRSLISKWAVIDLCAISDASLSLICYCVFRYAHLIKHILAFWDKIDVHAGFSLLKFLCVNTCSILYIFAFVGQRRKVTICVFLADDLPQGQTPPPPNAPPTPPYNAPTLPTPQRHSLPA